MRHLNSLLYYLLPERHYLMRDNQIWALVVIRKIGRDRDGRQLIDRTTFRCGQRLTANGQFWVPKGRRGTLQRIHRHGENGRHQDVLEIRWDGYDQPVFMTLSEVDWPDPN